MCQNKKFEPPVEKVYNLGQHTRCVIIYLSKNDALIQLCDILKKQHSIKINNVSEKTCITYNKQRTKVLSWGDATTENRPTEGDIQISNFMNGLYHVFKKDKKNASLRKAVSDFLSLAMEKLMNCPEMENKGLDSLHYVFIVPSEWEEEIREELIRPIFIEASLIFKRDHKDRLLFISEIEPICYNWSNSFKRGQNTILCRVAPTDSDTASIKLDLIKTTNTLFDFPNSMLFPKVMNSCSISITSSDIKNHIKVFLKGKLLPKDNSQEKVIEIIAEAIYCSVDTWRVIKSKDSWPSSINRLFLKNDDDNDVMLMKPLFRDTTKWKLDDVQAQVLKSIRPFDICSVIGKALLGKMRDTVSNQLGKKYEFLIVHDWYSSKVDLNLSLEIWLKYMLTYNIQALNEVKNMNRANSKSHSINLNGIISGAEKLVQETIQNSNIYCLPRIIPAENQAISSSVFLNSKPDAIFNIDISLKSTILSCALLNDDGLAQDILDHNYFTSDDHLPSLENFYDVSNVVTLTVKEQFISFVDKYLQKDFDAFSINENFVLEIRNILRIDWSDGEKWTYIRQQNYIKAFLLTYLIYIQYITSKKLLKHAKLENTVTKIGYAVTIEKNVLDSITGSKKELEELIYKSGFLEKNDKYKKLRILTQGEGVLSIIQQSFSLEFPVKSYFVLAQLHEDYIQITLNQVVTASSNKGKQQEAIIIEDRIFSIQNIYDSLCLNIWNNLIQDNSSIQLCALHNKSSNDDEMFELLSLETQKEFTIYLKEYISDNVLHKNSNLQKFSKNSIKLKTSCDCKVCLNINDIIDISFKPLLKNITSIILTSLINDDLFGRYSNIKYHFSLIHFNHNPQLLDILTGILEEESVNFNPKRGIDTLCMVIPRLPNQCLELVPYLYKIFQKGTLCQIYNKNYAFVMFESNEFNGEQEESHYFEEQESKSAFLLLKKEDRVSGTEMSHTFFFDKPNNWKFAVAIEIYEYEPSDFSKDERVTVKKDTWKNIAKFDIFLNPEEYENSRVPLMITIKLLGYSSILQLSARIVGNDIEEYNIPEIGYPMTLCRY